MAAAEPNVSRISTERFAAMAVEIVGDARIRRSEQADAVAGVSPSFVVEPSSVQEVSEVLSASSEAGLAVAPRGAGTKIAWGNPPERLDVVLSTARLDRVLEHAAGDLVVRLEAGCRLDDLRPVVKATGQMLALDPPEPGATLGGIVSTNASGPRRLRYGTARDLLIGLTVVLADGTVAKAGGKVVKNVAGYDLAKLFTGSLGTLGVIVQVIFRLHPLPAAARSVAVEVSDAEAAARAVEAMTGPGLVPSSVELAWPEHHGPGSVRGVFEGIEPGVAAQAERAAAGLRGAGLEPRIAQGSDDDTDQTEADTGLGGRIAMRVSHPPADLAAVLEEMWSASTRHGFHAAITSHAAVGSTLVSLSPGQASPDGALAVQALRSIAVARGGSATVLEAPAAIGQAVDAWGSVGDAQDLMRRVKERFDPGRTLNPGRFVAGI